MWTYVVRVRSRGKHAVYTYTVYVHIFLLKVTCVLMELRLRGVRRAYNKSYKPKAIKVCENKWTLRGVSK